MIASALIAAITLLIADQPAPAKPADTDVPSIALTVGPMDAATPQASLILLRRIERAAENACGADTSSPRVIRRAVRASACYTAAVDQAVARINQPLLSQAHGKGQ